MTVKTQKFSVL